MTHLENVIAATARNVTDELGRLTFGLDGSASSLKTLDEAITALLGDAAPSDEYLDGMVWGYGCYVADVLQRNYTGRWRPADGIGYEFEFRGSTLRCNPWELVERRFRLGTEIAPVFASYTDKIKDTAMNSVDHSALKTSVVIQGRGLSLAFLEIDQEAFQLLTTAGISESDYQELLDDIEEDGHIEAGLLLGYLKVSVNDQVFTCSWDKIKSQLGERRPQPRRAYEELGPGEYFVVLERPFETEWVELEVENYRHSMLEFDVECIEPAKGTNVMLMDFSFNGNGITYTTTYSEEASIYIVDGYGNRHMLKLAFEW